MAIYHMSIKIGSKGKGQSAVAAAAYLDMQMIYSHNNNAPYKREVKRGKLLWRGQGETEPRLVGKSKKGQSLVWQGQGTESLPSESALHHLALLSGVYVRP